MPTETNYSPGVDKNLTCVKCGEEFVFTAGEQEYYAQRNLTTPRRCSVCREKRRLVEGTFGRRVVIVDMPTDLVLCSRCRNPASKKFSIEKGETLCSSCAGGAKVPTAKGDFLVYDDWRKLKGKNPYDSRT